MKESEENVIIIMVLLYRNGVIKIVLFWLENIECMYVKVIFLKIMCIMVWINDMLKLYLNRLVYVSDVIFMWIV